MPIYNIEPGISIEPGVFIDDRRVICSGLFGPRTHPRSNLASNEFARLVQIGDESLWSTFSRNDKLIDIGAGALPVPLRALWRSAVDARWLVRIMWSLSSSDHPYVTFECGRHAEQGQEHFKIWRYIYTWHTYPHGTYRLSGKTEETPTQRRAHTGPSLQTVHGVIAAHPVD